MRLDMPTHHDATPMPDEDKACCYIPLHATSSQEWAATGHARILLTMDALLAEAEAEGDVGLARLLTEARPMVEWEVAEGSRPRSCRVQLLTPACTMARGASHQCWV